MTEEKLEKQMRKTGNTPFFFEKLECYLEGNLFLPVQALNELRRTGWNSWEKQYCSHITEHHGFWLLYPEKQRSYWKKKKKHVG